MPRRKRGSASAPDRSDSARSAWDRLYPTLDLHGDTAAQARRRAQRWLEERREEGAPTVRIITGWGAHSVGPPVLRAEIESLLDSLRGRAIIRYSRETGGGALRVELRPPDSRHRGSAPAHSAVSPGAPIDPELRRRAEEALEELGITPTPELIDAEIRRMRREREKDRGR